MLFERDLPIFLWDEAVAHTAYLRNRALTKALDSKTPFEAWHRKKPDVAHLREFGSKVWVIDEMPNISSDVQGPARPKAPGLGPAY